MELLEIKNNYLMQKPEKDLIESYENIIDY